MADSEDPIMTVTGLTSARASNNSSNVMKPSVGLKAADLCHTDLIFTFYPIISHKQMHVEDLPGGTQCLLNQGHTGSNCCHFAILVWLHLLQGRLFLRKSDRFRNNMKRLQLCYSSSARFALRHSDAFS